MPVILYCLKTNNRVRLPDWSHSPLAPYLLIFALADVAMNYHG